jgi:hypothetical protein
MGLPLGLTTWQGHPGSLSFDRIALAFVVSLFLERFVLLGLSWAWVLCWDHSHDLIAELFEQSTLGWLCHAIVDHVSHRAPFHG